MRLFFMTCIAAMAVFAVPSVGWAGQIVIEKATVDFIEDARVPAQEEGVLREVYVRDGQAVKKNAPLAQIDDTLVNLQLDVAKAESAVAKRRFEDDISIRYAASAAKVYRQDYRRCLEANRDVPGTFPQAEVELARLKVVQYDLQTEKSQSDQVIAGLEMKVSEAKEKAANEHITRSKVVAPWEGIVDRVWRFTGDWVKPGDPIMRMIRMDRLRVTCDIDATKYGPNNIDGQRVAVQVTLPGGAQQVFHGRIAGYSQNYDGLNNTFQAWAELENPQHNGRYALWPGMVVKMVIETKQ